MNITKKLGSLNDYLNTNKILPIFIWLLYVCLLCYVSYYHEPWHDEGQAWLIARDDSIWHLLTVTTHWEGHPPLWHLLLMPFAKAGLPFEITIKIINITLCSMAIGLLVFKSPFPWYLRTFLPFTYFLFFQYGVINRTYSLLMFGMMLAAYYYPVRCEHPFKVIFALLIVSGSQAYGMMIATGIMLSWLCNVIYQRKKNCKLLCVKSFFYSQEIKAMVVWFLITFLFGLCMLPLQDTAYTKVARSTFFENFFYSLIVVPNQVFCTNDVKDSLTNGSITFFINALRSYADMWSTYGIYALLIICQFLFSYLYGVIIQFVMLLLGWYTGLASLFVLPLISYFILASSVYLRNHHFGVLACFYVFYLWQLFSINNCIWQSMILKIRNKFSKPWEYTLSKGILFVGIFIILFINISWSYDASRLDIAKPYDFDKELSIYIRDNHMEEATIWAPWTYNAEKDKVMSGSFAINAFFKKNMIQNLNGGKSPYAFLEYRLLDRTNFEENLRLLGKPEFLLGDVPINDIFPKSKDEYIPVKKFPSYIVFKNLVKTDIVVLCIRRDVLNKYSSIKDAYEAENNVEMKKN